MEYKVVKVTAYIHVVGEKNADVLAKENEKVMNDMAKQGWSYHSVIVTQTIINKGCCCFKHDVIQEQNLLVFSK